VGLLGGWVIIGLLGNGYGIIMGKEVGGVNILLYFFVIIRILN